MEITLFLREKLIVGELCLRLTTTINSQIDTHVIINHLLDGLAVFKLDLSQLTSAGEAAGATFNLLIYARNLKGESEKTLLENIAFNDAARRTGNMNIKFKVLHCVKFLKTNENSRYLQLYGCWCCVWWTFHEIFSGFSICSKLAEHHDCT